MGKALYRKYRSRSLDEIVGQPHVVEILQRALKTDTLGHAYLLTGIRGVGKTSIARILAHEINGLPYHEDSTHLDIIEIDAASNSSVEDIRDLREKSMIAPVSAPKKVYIIDEVHMLSKSAFNALLKTLEEPPAHVVFILATTDVHKLPSTILSRVQRFNLRPISVEDIQSHLKTIAEKEKIAINTEALRLLAVHGNGSFRDAISLLDQARNSASDGILAEHIESSLGLVESEKISKLFDYYISGDTDNIISTVRSTEHAGLPVTSLIDQLLIEGKQRVYTDHTILPLLDRLVEARRSQWPDVKLLAALVLDTAPIISQSAKKLAPEPQSAITPTSNPVAQKPRETKKTVDEKPSKKQPAIDTSTNENTQGPPVDFAWEPFIESVRNQSMGAFSVLTRCGYVYDGTTLAIYCGKPFAKKQLEKALPALSAGLQSLDLAQVTIKLHAETKPSNNQDVAAALAIMGGGEEVKVHE